MELPRRPEIIDCKVHVAVGKSTAKAISILNWACRRFPGEEICILHVHQPSPLIPTLLGKLPASQASHEVVSAYRTEEKEKSTKLLLGYLSLCRRSKVKASILEIEAAQVQNGIIDLVNNHGIKHLVMGAVPESCMKVKRSSKKANYAAKFAPHFCQIWFIYKGKHVWTRESSYEEEEEIISSTSSSTRDNSTKTEEESLYNHLIEMRLEIEALRMEASQERSKSKELEAGAVESINNVKDLESACGFEIKLTMEAEDAVKDAIQNRETLLEKREETLKKLQKTIRNIAVLDSRVQEANRRCEEAASELKVLETSIASLQREKRRMQRQRAEATRWLGSWKSNAHNDRHDEGRGSNGLLAKFSIVDLQTATCNFSESFIIGEGGNGCVYKGEMLDRTVAIKMWHPRNMQGQQEFQQQVWDLGKLRHSHLVTLVDICPEAWSVVHEHLPSGNLGSFLIRKNNINKPSLTWKERARLVAEISSTLLFLHSKSVIHGNLKPENILLNNDLTCKLSDYGICTIVREETLRCPSFGRYNEPKGAFSHTDPEFHRTGILTPKSDVYSFGLIILQLLAGISSPIGLINEFRKAVSTRKLSAILDMSAGEWPTFVARRLVDLGLQFCELNNSVRPLITSALVKELQNLCSLEDRSVPSLFLCPINKEIMYDPQVASDGFTYEGEEIQTWLENGHETSPMTNLKLDHLFVTPNHSIRIAIQDWLCKP